jgi:hypothetical protein
VQDRVFLDVAVVVVVVAGNGAPKFVFSLRLCYCFCFSVVLQCKGDMPSTRTTPRHLNQRFCTSIPANTHHCLRLRLRLRFESLWVHAAIAELPDLPSLKLSSHWSLGLYLASTLILVLNEANSDCVSRC